GIGPPTTSPLVQVRGFGPTETVDITFDKVPLSQATTDPLGGFQARIQIPASARPGRHQIHAAGETSGLRARARFLVNADWPMFHDGPAQTGYDRVENVLDPSNVARLHKAWKYHDAVDPSPAVVGGTVFVEGYDLEALNARTGTLMWKVDLGNNLTP